MRKVPIHITGLLIGKPIHEMKGGTSTVAGFEHGPVAYELNLPEPEWVPELAKNLPRDPPKVNASIICNREAAKLCPILEECGCCPPECDDPDCPFDNTI